MSLINDALKRAAEADKRHQGGGRRRGGPRGPKGPEALGGPIEPMKPVRRRRVGFLFSPAFGLVMLVVILCCVAAFFIHSWWNSRPRFVLQNLPPGVDPLEAMIVETKPKKAVQEKKLIVVTEEGAQVASAEQTKNGKTAETQEPAPKTGTEPTVASIATGSTNATEKPVPPTAPEKPVRTARAPVSRAPTNDAPSAPTLLKVTTVEGSKTAEQVAAEQAALRTNTTTAARAVVAGATNSPPEAPITIVAAKPKKEEVEFPPIKLGGIFIKKDSAIAYVNGKTLSIGDEIEGAELVEITVQYVTFALNGAKKKYYLAQ